MKVKKFIPYASPNVKNTTPFVRVFPNTGCGARGCNCSEGWLLSVSNGNVGLLVTFDNEQEFKSYIQ